MNQRPDADTASTDVDMQTLGVAPSFAARCRSDEDGRTVIEVLGEVDLASRDDLWAEIEPRLSHDRLVIDLSGTTFLDSIGLNLILRASRERAAGSDQLVLRAPSDAVCKLLRITGVDAVVTVEAAQPEA